MLSRSSHHRMQYGTARVLRILFGIRTEGIAVIPRLGGLLIASNHISEFDPPILGVLIPRVVHFMAKKELLKTAFLRSLMNMVSAFPVDRKSVDRNTLTIAEKLINSGEAVLVFPEGTRSRNGNILPPKAGIGLLSRRCNVPVLPVFISGTDKPFRALLRNPSMRVVFGNPIPACVLRKIDEKYGYREVASEIMKRIAVLAHIFHQVS